MRLAPGLQVPPQMTSDHDGDQSSGLTLQLPQFHRAQSVTSAVDYEYFDVGIGQVAHALLNVFKPCGAPEEHYLISICLTGYVDVLQFE